MNEDTEERVWELLSENKQHGLVMNSGNFVCESVDLQSKLDVYYGVEILGL